MELKCSLSGYLKLNYLKENNKGTEILKLMQDNYDLKKVWDLSNNLKDMFIFKVALQEIKKWI